MRRSIAPLPLNDEAQTKKVPEPLWGASAQGGSRSSLDGNVAECPEPAAIPMPGNGELSPFDLRPAYVRFGRSAQISAGEALRPLVAMSRQSMRDPARKIVENGSAS